MRHQLLARFARAIFVAWGVSLVAFGLMRLLPGDPATVLLGENATPEKIEALREQLNLSGNIFEQYGSFAGDAIRGDLGESFATGQNVTSTVRRTLPVTLWLIGGTLTVAVIVAVPLGVVAGTYRRKWFDPLFKVVASALLATPVFVTAIFALLLLAVRFNVAPVAGWTGSFPANLEFLWLPSLVSGIPLGMVLARVLQSSIRETNEQEFVETAIVWGIPNRTLVWRYIVRPSIAPTVGLMGYIVGGSLAAAVILESIFGMPGVGSFLVNGVLARDFSVVQGTLVVFGLIVVLVHFLADVLSGWLDPRARAVS